MYELQTFNPPTGEYQTTGEQDESAAPLADFARNAGYTSWRVVIVTVREEQLQRWCRPLPLKVTAREGFSGNRKHGPRPRWQWNA